MIVFPNAKINLGLNVVERRSDGYHNIETLFYPIALSDVLEITLPEASSQKVAWQQTGLELDSSADDNLCMKAVRALAERVALPSLAIHLHKIIPSGAGLGGGSSDASFTLTTLNALLGLGFSNGELREMASKIGADCAFFVENKPMLASGIGEVLTPAEVSLKGRRIVLVKPDIHVSTRDVYNGMTPRRPEVSIAQIVKRPIEEWRGLLQNDMERTVFAKHPAIGEIKETLYAMGAVYASMSGSGSSVYGIFNGEPENLDFGKHYVWQGTLN